MAQGISAQLLIPKLRPYLPDDAIISQEATTGFQQSVTHPSANRTRNMDFLGTKGDIVLKYCLCLMFCTENPNVRDPLGLEPEDIAVGGDYAYANQQRSVHRRGTVVEAFLAVIDHHLGLDACRVFVRRVWSAFFRSQGVAFTTFKHYDPISQMETKLAQHMEGQPKDWLAVHEDGPTAQGQFWAEGGIKSAPYELLRGPVYARSKNKAKRAIYTELDSDPRLTAFITNHVKPPKKSRLARPLVAAADDAAAGTGAQSSAGDTEAATGTDETDGKPPKKSKPAHPARAAAGNAAAETDAPSSAADTRAAAGSSGTNGLPEPPASSGTAPA
ncbi:hypothetical protein KFL_000320050 [Klebsormidium nitens]|uniref:Uncharacterized protein n=1 Tax=Klebsormidium nitens TaxID=105231 RepID=A0A1Y1HSH7_KLENI|nr:hypothetical protein KFL_000320050 [Klebsormidium nitens]|eukprot:GAQ79507.1 hypothetical protein KFL_000320050 [Klebsormidium nitens]